jgi:hypothetical protein
MNTIIIEKDRFHRSVSSWNNYFNGLEWLIRARANDETRRNLGMISCRDGFLCCTDGHRLHLFAPDYDQLPADCLIPDGLYEVKAHTKKQIILVLNEEGLQYPEYWRVLEYKRHNGIKPIDIAFGKNVNTALTYYAYHISTSTHKMINLDYVKDAMIEGHVMFETDGQDIGPLVMGNGEQLAVLMPLKQ